jgi:hypothetical protein
MIHAYFTPITICFIYTLWQFYDLLHNVLILQFDVYELPRIQVEILLELNWGFPEIYGRTVFEDGHVMGRRQRQTKNSSITKL